MAADSPVRYSRSRKSRGRGLRTTSGCLTCRKRHIKCDDRKPICGPCVKSSKTCSYAPSGNRSTATSEAGHQISTQQESPGGHQIANNLSRVAASNEPVEIEPAPWSRRDGEDAVHGPASHQLPGTVPATLRNLPNNHLPSPQTPSVSQSVAATSTASPGPTVNAATVRWFGLLASDAARESSQLSTTLLSDCASLENAENAHRTQLTSLQRATQVLDYHVPGISPDGSPGDINEEKQLWQAQEPIELLAREHFLFDHFVQRVSQWIDLFDPTSQFSIFVPHLAICNAGLMNAILALSCRHLSLNPRLDNDNLPKGEAAIQYYYQTLHYVQKAMQYSSYKTSLELLATVLIISAYEMLDNSSNDWERHLEGVFLIQRSQLIHGESGGLHAAVWWAWICQDVWAAFRERRKALTFWIPQKPLASLTSHELAARSVYIMAKVVNFCSQQEPGVQEGIQVRMDKAKELHSMLDDWKTHLTIEFTPLPVVSDERTSYFRPLHIRPASFGVSMQIHCAARILLLSHEPHLGGINVYLQRQTVIQRCIETICGIAMTLKDDASSFLSSQVLFIAGMVTQDIRAREAVLGLLDSCRQRTGWPVKPLGDELQQLWNVHTASSAAGEDGVSPPLT